MTFFILFVWSQFPALGFCYAFLCCIKNPLTYRVFLSSSHLTFLISLWLKPSSQGRFLPLKCTFSELSSFLLGAAQCYASPYCTYCHCSPQMQNHLESSGFLGQGAPPFPDIACLPSLLSQQLQDPIPSCAKNHLFLSRFQLDNLLHYSALVIIWHWINLHNMQKFLSAMVLKF